MFKRHWTFHLLPILSLLQVTGHLVSVYHLILLKPLPIIILIFLAERRTPQERFFFYGLLASLGGDLCLMSRDMYIFQFGTFLFLLAHVLYIRVFVFDISESNLRRLKKKRHITLLAFITFILTLLVFNLNELWNKTPNLPLYLIYGVVLSGMAITSCLRSHLDSSYWLVLAGALCFGISDNTLAYFKFNNIKSEAAAAFIMATYYAAQCLMWEGIRLRNCNQ
jgi:uncharacterized membrane protein YhhN